MKTIIKKLDLLFVDGSIKGFDRYAVPLSGVLKQQKNDLTVGACYIEKEDIYPLRYIDEVISAQEYSLNIPRILETYQPKTIVVFAHRVFDYIFTVEAHKRGIKVFNFQHALYNTRGNSFLPNSSTKRKYHRISQFAYYLEYIMQLVKSNPAKTIDIFFAFGKYRTMSQVFDYLFKEQSNADISYIYGAYWENFYRKNYLERSTSFEIIGYPELEQESKSISCLDFNNELPVLCYLAETVAESTDEMWEMFINNLINLLPELNLVIKFHPRSDRDKYSKLFQSQSADHIFIWDEKAFPECKYYLGHESTVLSRALYISDSTLICRIDPNRESPFERFSKYVICDVADLKSAFENMLTGTHENRNVEDISNFSKKNEGLGALRQMAESILTVLNQ